MRAPTRYVTGFVNSPTKCRQGHRHGSPETALGCDAMRWQARLVDTMGLTPEAAASLVMDWQVKELAARAAARARARGRGPGT